MWLSQNSPQSRLRPRAWKVGEAHTSDAGIASKDAREDDPDLMAQMQ
jgi:hypothetical protein